MTRRISYILLLILCHCKLFAGQFDEVKALVARRAPWLSGHVVFKPMANTGKDVFELSTQNGKLIIGATGPNSAAVGLNWYLKYYCHRSMSHMGDNLAPVASLPVIKQPLRITAPAQVRYALNYCTYNYTMSFYSWKDWERELDWMALNGVNVMLTVEGMEAVWQNTLKQAGYNDKEINDFIVGPAYTAWWLMGNIEGWGGPMPQSQIDNRKLIQQKMMARMNALGIEPVLQGFYGMVPSSLKNKIKAHIIDQGAWGAFKRPEILDPTDPEFSHIAGIYYKEMQKLYGNNIRYFAGDPFHEGGKTDGIDLSKAGAAIQAQMQLYYPGSIWVLQGWQDNPKKQMLAGLDKSKVLVQELFGEFTNNWEKRDAYEGTPFIWCTVNNFGERPGVYGKLQRFADETDRARKSPLSGYLKGVGIMPEGINNNPPDYDLMLELGWRQEHVNTQKWIEGYTTYRYGKSNPHISKAWEGFLATIYQSLPGYQEGAGESIFCARPALKINSTSSWGTFVRNYDSVKFEHAVQELANAAPALGNSSTYKIDLINMARQVLANKGAIVFKELTTAYNKKDIPAFNKSSAQFLKMIKLTDDLLNTDSYFKLNTYLKQATTQGNTPDEKANNLNNALMLITYWGENVRAEDNLHEYAYKEWAGFMNSFYLPRWQLYFNYLKNNLEEKPTEAPDFFTWERQWVKDNQKLQPETKSRPLNEVVKEIMAI
ncbi:alpha-N-acetylglucosaminidase [Mucilaginibacter pineti]|nr:alpha-N-acetylglucosaminidase [Mucilaginibacter pineti]